MGVISIPSDKKDAILCVHKMYQGAVASEAAEVAAPAKESKRKKKASTDASKESEKRTSLECPTLIDDLPKSSNSKRSKATAPALKKVPVGLAGADGTFTISATLDGK